MELDLDYLKKWAEIIAALGTAIAAIGAFLIYRSNSRLERSRWASNLFEMFFVKGEFKEIRDLIDCPADSEQINKLVIEEKPEFTDYLNFFEFVAFLKESKQLRDSEVEALFGYYLNCFRQHDRLQTYIKPVA